MRMRYLVFVFAAAIAGLAMQYGTATTSETISMGTMNVMKMQMQADKDMPIMEMGNLV